MNSKLFHLVSFMRALTRKITLLFVVIWIAFAICNEHLVRNTSSTMVLPITDFYDFECQDNQSDYIITNNTGDSVIFSYNASGSEIQSKYYSYNLTSNYSDFDIEVTVDYNYTGERFGRFSLNLKSYFDEQMQKLDTMDGTALAQVTVYDAWSYSGGVFNVIGWPNDVALTNETARGETGHSGTVIFKIQRIGEELFLSVEQNEAIKIYQNWSYGVSRPLNFISFGGYFYDNETYLDTDGFDITIRAIDATLTLLIESTSNPNFSLEIPGFSTAIALVCLMLFGLRRFIYRKKRC